MIVLSIYSSIEFIVGYSSGYFGSRKSLSAIITDCYKLVFVAYPPQRVASCAKIAGLT